MSKSFFLTLVASTFLVGAATTHATVKESDLDGLTDEAETNIYHTDPLLYDTDGDSIADGQEVIDGTDPLNPESSKLAQLNTEAEKASVIKRLSAWFAQHKKGALISIFLVSGLAALLTIATLIKRRHQIPTLVPKATSEKVRRL